MTRTIQPVTTVHVPEKTYGDPPMHPRERMAIVEEAVTVALDPDATEQEREDARQKLEALRDGGEG